MMINAGSGQRPFPKPWINIDTNPKWNPDQVCDMSRMPFEDGAADIIVSHHTLEHLWQADAVSFLRECNRVLREGGSLLVFVPNMKALASAWVLGNVPDYTYFVNVYGAYMGDEADWHRWGYSRDSLTAMLNENGKWAAIKEFNRRKIPGADLSRDWWILGLEAVK